VRRKLNQSQLVRKFCNLQTASKHKISLKQKKEMIKNKEIIEREEAKFQHNKTLKKGDNVKIFIIDFIIFLS
jgi:hypothetical protein